MNKLLIALIASFMGAAVFGSPTSVIAKPIVKTAVEASEKIAVKKAAGKGLETAAKTGVEVAAKGATHAGVESMVKASSALAIASAEHEAAKKTAAEIAGKVTPRHVLAAGGATALVVAAHECSDGVQTLCDSIGDTVQENPDKLPALLDFAKYPISLIVTIATLVVLGVIAWFLAPWISLFRNWIRLKAMEWNAKLREKIDSTAAQDKDDVDAAPSVASASESSSCSGKIDICMALSLAGSLILTVAMIAGAVWLTGHVCRMARLRSEYRAEINRHYTAFRAEVDTVASAEFDRVRAGVPAVADQFGTMSQCARLARVMVSDKMKKGGGNKLEKTIQDDLEVRYYRSLYAARDNVAKCVDRLIANLEQSRWKYNMAVSAGLESIKELDDTAYLNCLADGSAAIDSKKLDLKLGQISAGVSVAVEAICIRQTVATVSKFLGRAIARQTGVMAGSAVAAAADGPLPIGDIVGGVVTIGCTVWTGVDIYRAAHVLPKELRKTLSGVTNDCEGECRKEVLATGERIVNEYS